jgi:hypothetical protein
MENGGHSMQQQPIKRSSSNGSKAIALDRRAEMARYRLWLFISMLLAAGSALGLQLIFR